MALNAKVMLGIAASVLVALGAALEDDEKEKEQVKSKPKKKKVAKTIKALPNNSTTEE